jgi:hypothetical protein
MSALIYARQGGHPVVGFQNVPVIDKPKVTCNTRMGSRELKAFCELDEATNDLLRQAGTENISGDHIPGAILTP